jgi:fluoride exporter
MIALGFGALAVLGTLARWRIGMRLPPPTGTLVVNLAGSFGVGLLAGSGAGSVTVVGVGGLGALTTFSTLMVELAGLWRTDPYRAVAYGAVTFVGGIALAWLGLRLA